MVVPVEGYFSEDSESEDDIKFIGGRDTNIEDLLSPEDGGKPVRFILVEGPPGIGI